MKTITLTKKEVKLLIELLSLDMDNIGFSDSEQVHLNNILKNILSFNAVR